MQANYFAVGKNVFGRVYSIIKEIKRLINWSMEHLIIPSSNKITRYSFPSDPLS